MALFTCSYSEFERHQAPERLPVRTTVGAPSRRPPTYSDQMAYLHEVTPLRRFLRPVVLPYEQYRTEYRLMLNQHGVTRIQAKMRALAENSGRPDLVLLCFDNLAAPSGWCHRTMFAEWWIEVTGEEVIELGRQFQAPVVTVEQDALFRDIADGT